jgi:hypothetical protein
MIEKRLKPRTKKWSTLHSISMQQAKTIHTEKCGVNISTDMHSFHAECTVSLINGDHVYHRRSRGAFTVTVTQNNLI